MRFVKALMVISCMLALVGVVSSCQPLQAQSTIMPTVTFEVKPTVIPRARQEMQDDEKSLLVTVRDLKSYSGLSGEPDRAETFSKRQVFLDGSYEVQYEYDSAMDPESSKKIFILSEAQIERTAVLASSSFGDAITGSKFGTAFSDKGIELREDSGLFVGGDESYSAYFEKNGKIVGNLIIVRKQNVVMTLMLIGIYFDDSELLLELLQPKLDAVEGLGKD